jgi:hypothetical protein
MQARFPVRAASLLVALAGVGIAPFACGDLGEPAFEGPDGEPTGQPTSTTTMPTTDAETDSTAPLVRLHGRVHGVARQPPFALVAIELGGLNQKNPAALGPGGEAEPTVKIDRLYAYGAATDETGAFSLLVPDEKIGVHVYANGFRCGVPEAGAIVPAKEVVSVTPISLTEGDGSAAPQKPTITDFTASPEVVMPGESVTLAAQVEAADPEHDPLSEQVLGIEPATHWAGAFAPPSPGTSGKGYPNGLYGRLVIAPMETGEYVYYLVAATESCVVSEPARVVVRVSISGEGGLEDADAGVSSDAPIDTASDIQTEAEAAAD